MANKGPVPSPVLPLPPLEYDFQYMNALVRLLNYFIEQQDNPGRIQGTELALLLYGPNAGVVETQAVMSVQYNLDPASPLVNKTIVNIANLPTSATGLSTGDIWNNSGTLKIV